MLKQAMRIAAAAAFLCQLQVPAAVLQTAAWAAMAWRYSRTHSAAEAAAMTFDGNHPCGLCVRLQHRAGSGRELAFRGEPTRQTAVLLPSRPGLRAPSAAVSLSSSLLFVLQSVPAPGTPPPKDLLG